MKIFVQKGDVATVTATADVKSGDLVVKGDLVGVAQADASTGEAFAAAVSGVFQLPVTATADVDQGDPIYLDGTDLTTDDASGANPQVGYAFADATEDAGTATVNVKLAG